MSTCNWRFSADLELKRQGAAWAGDGGDACPGTQLPLFCHLRGRAREEGGGGEDRDGLKGYLREWLSCKLNVQDTELWLAEPKLRVSSCSSIRSRRACFF